ncbi:unnamed protein product [Parascedosporium putredinis]|uniref:Uncharacterized protein n=1 Tax=Parascedosporium putredinis TaxID=1442378 RepID=A0A9P1M9J4_9PEZI|nr:unnamed protein product [Parascedosporium putredinis]CAI7990876.1 unnamed protein product [Parascedosporium putredinis]
MRRGFGPNHSGDQGLHIYGIDDLRDDAVAVFVVTPRPRVALYRFGFGGERVPDSIRLNRDANANQLLYGPRVGRLTQELWSIFGPSIPLEVVDYSPLVPGNEILDRFLEVRRAYDDTRDMITTAEGGLAFPDDSLADLRNKLNDLESQLQKAEEDFAEASRDTQFRSPQGKVMIQYRPAHNCEDKARWRLWVDGRPLQGREGEWDPYPEQILLDWALRKRQGSSGGTMNYKDPFSIGRPAGVEVGKDCYDIVYGLYKGCNTQQQRQPTMASYTLARDLAREAEFKYFGYSRIMTGSRN